MLHIITLMNVITRLKKLLPKRIVIVEVPISTNNNSVNAITKAFNDWKLKGNFIILENQRIEKVRIKTIWQW